MGCCGQRRDQMRMQSSGAMVSPFNSAEPTERRSSPPEPPGRGSMWSSSALASLGKGAVALRYRERARVQVRGPVTGRNYEFSSNQSAVVVDARDVEALLRTRHFTRVG